MRALAAAIQDGRADLHLSVDELAERSGVPSNTIWRLLDDLQPALSSEERRLLTGLAHGLHQPPELLYRAALTDAGWTPPETGSPVEWFDSLPDYQV